MTEFGKALAGWLLARGVLEDACGASLEARWFSRQTDPQGRPISSPRASLPSFSGGSVVSDHPRALWERHSRERAAFSARGGSLAAVRGDGRAGGSTPPPLAARAGRCGRARRHRCRSLFATRTESSREVVSTASVPVVPVSSPAPVSPPALVSPPVSAAPIPAPVAVSVEPRSSASAAAPLFEGQPQQAFARAERIACTRGEARASLGSDLAVLRWPGQVSRSSAPGRRLLGGSVLVARARARGAERGAERRNTERRTRRRGQGALPGGRSGVRGAALQGRGRSLSRGRPHRVERAPVVQHRPRLREARRQLGGARLLPGLPAARTFGRKNAAEVRGFHRELGRQARAEGRAAAQRPFHAERGHRRDRRRTRGGDALDG